MWTVEGNKVPEESEKPSDEIEHKTLDDLLDVIGHVGRLQKRMLFVMALVAFAVGYQNVSPVFTLNIPKHRCKITELENDTYSSQGTRIHEWYVNRSIPRNADGKYDECYIYSYEDGEDRANVTASGVHKCSSWVYDKSVFERTITTDLDLVCDEKIMRSHSNMLIFAGKFIGAILQGFASDIFGRKKVLLVTTLGVLGTAIGNGFVTDVGSLLALRFLTGMMTTALYLVIFVIGVEFMVPSHRTVAGTALSFCFALGQMSLDPFAVFIRDWRYLQLAIAWPAAVLVLVVWVVPESPRWLLSKNRKQEAEAVIQKAAKINRSTLPHNVTAYLHLNEEHTRLPVYHLFNDHRLVIRWTVVYINWIVIAMVYYGLTLNVSNMSGNIFLNFFLTSAVDVLSKIFTGLVASRVSRKFFHLSVMLLAGGACAAVFIPVLTGAEKWIVIALSMVGKFGISCAFYLIYMYTAELFPTTYRALGMGSSSMMARIGGIASPYVADLNTYVGGEIGKIMPQLVFGGAGIIGGLLVFLLPDTRDRKLPETIDDAKHFTDKPEKNHLSEKLQKNAVV